MAQMVLLVASILLCLAERVDHLAVAADGLIRLVLAERAERFVLFGPVQLVSSLQQTQTMYL
jgi:hypothetical protein